MGKGNRIREARKQQQKFDDYKLDYEIEECDNYTVESWTDPRITAEDLEGRSRQADMISDEIRAEENENGFGFWDYNVRDNRFYSYTFDTQEEADEFLASGRYMKKLFAGEDLTGVEANFGLLGLTINMADPRNAEYFEAAFALTKCVRAGFISEKTARAVAANIIKPYTHAA